MEDGCREYQSSLEDLTFNSKPHINMLTILAEENLTYAKEIVAIIEAQISKAPSSEKLPVLYLVDSIVKNVGGEYLAVFAKNLITSFICVFEKVDENTRKSLFKLRSTWDEVFPLKKLYALDVRVNALDPAWPIKPLPPTVNASIHVNPKFLKQSDEASSPQPVPSKPPTPPPPAAPVSPKPVQPAAPSPAPSSLTQEQMIRQQLLAKQKQLLELQQKKIELELEQTKAQLAGGFVLPTSNPVPTPPLVQAPVPAPVPAQVLNPVLAPVPAPVQPVVTAPAPSTLSTAQRSTTQTSPVVRPWIPPATQAEPKPSTRDPRLNRPSTAQPKDQHAGKKASATTGSPAHTPEKNRPDRTRTGRRDVPEEKPKSKSPSPLTKSVHSKNKPAEAEHQKSSDGTKKDPRLKKRPQERTGDDEQKDKKRCSERRSEEGPRSKGKLVNGSVGKHDRDDASDKLRVQEQKEYKTGGNARTHARKRTRSRSRSRSPANASSPKRKDRRSPKSRTRSSSPSPSHKQGKPRRVRADEPEHSKDRTPAKKSQSESRRSKRPAEERDSPRGHDGGKEGKETAHRWRSGWEETKHLKPSEDTHMKPGAQRHKPYGPPNRPPTPRTPKHRLSVDANMQIPEALNSASKKDLLRRASKRLESGEISQEDFLNMAHQIKHFFQYQEEKLQQNSENWSEAANFPAKKALAPTPTTQPRPPDTMDPAELSYYEHKSKLRKTQVTHRAPGDEWEGEESPEDPEGAVTSEKTGRHSPTHKYSRAPRDRPGERRSKEREEARPHGPMIEYNHGKEFPTLKALPGLRFRRRADPREPSEQKWTSPLTERQRDEQKSGYDAPRRYGPPDSRHPDPRRPDAPTAPSGTVVHRNCPSPTALDPLAPRFEREPLSPLHQKDGADQSPAARFESPTSEHSDDGPLNLEPSHPHLPPKSILKAAGRGVPLSSVRPHSDSPGHTPPHDGGHPPSRFERPGGPSRPNSQGWFEGGGPGRFDDPSRFDGPHHPGPGRFDGPPHHNMERFEASRISHGPMRGGDTMGRFDGPPGNCQDPGRFDGHMAQQPGRFEGQGPMHFNSMAPGPNPRPMGFQQQRPMRFDGPPSQMGPLRFDGPGPMRFDNPGQGPPYDMPNVPHQGPPHYDCPPGQRFGPQHNLQPTMRPMAPPLYDNPLPPQQNFNMAPQRFQDPLNPSFSGPIGGGLAFPQQNLQAAGNFSMQPAQPFSQTGPAPFFNPTTPAVGLQPVNMFQPQNLQLFGSTTAPPVAPPENHFGQVDVNDLLTKLISTGIIKPSQPDVNATSSAEATPTPAAPTVPVEEEEEEDQEAEEDENLPDLTSFSIDGMKQRYESVVTKLYSGNQCCLCSMRFTAAQTDMYADHLDWHFRQNHAGKVASKKITHRRWYYSLTDWIEFEEIADLEERAKSLFFEKESEEEVQKSQAAAKEKEFQCVRAAKDQVGELCEICQEPFETYWVEEEEDWFLKNAIRVDDKNFHPSCFEDYKNSSYVDVTPSPNKLLNENPLEAFIKKEEQEEEELASCCASSPSSSIKQEVKTVVNELPVMKQEEEQQQPQEEQQEQGVLSQEVKVEQDVKL